MNHALLVCDPLQVAGVVALGGANLVGVLLLAGLLTDPAARYTLAYNGLGWLPSLLPGLQVGRL
jgi:hypothetical protein